MSTTAQAKARRTQARIDPRYAGLKATKEVAENRLAKLIERERDRALRKSKKK